MPSQDAKRAPDPEAPGHRLSRRSLLQGAATAGAAGLAVTALGGAASPALALSPPGASRAPAADQSHGHNEARTPAGPIVAHVRDARSGDIEVFSGTGQARVRDQDLAARIARVIG